MEHYAVIGLGAFGNPVARRLAKQGQDVLAIDIDERLVEEIKDHVARAVVADATDRETLEALGMAEFSTAVVAIGEQREANILVTATLREMGLPRIVARATSDLHARILTAVGAHRIVSPEVDYGLQLADNLVSSFVLERFALAEGITVAEFSTHSSMHGKTLRELDLRGRFGVNVVAIQKRLKAGDGEGNSREAMSGADIPEPGRALREGEVLVLLGSDEALDQLTRTFSG